VPGTNGQRGRRPESQNTCGLPLIDYAGGNENFAKSAEELISGMYGQSAGTDRGRGSLKAGEFQKYFA